MPKRVTVIVDDEGNFKYIDESRKDATRVKVSVNDTLSWNVRLDGKATPFQISFKTLSPFKAKKEIRSDGGLTIPEAVTTKHAGKGMSYTVTLPNGWANDPEALVEPAGGESGLNTTPDAEIPVEPDAAGKIPLPDCSHVALKGWVFWTSDDGPFKVTFTQDSPFAGTAKEHPSQQDGKLSRQVRKDADLKEYPYTIVMTGDVPGTGHSKLAVVRT